MKAKCIRLSRICHLEYISNVENQTYKNIKYFWNYVNKLKQNSGIPDSMFLGVSKGNDTKSVCELFSSYFKSVYRISNNSSTVNFPLLKLITEQFELDEITNHDIITALNKMQAKPSVGPNLIPSSFLKRCNLTVIYPLRLLFCQSLTQGHMPEIWKKSYITHVHKSGNVHDVTNCRPISIMSCVAKLFESIITDKLTMHFIHTISESQHGFLKAKSAVTNLVL